jgi:transposase-like protein
MRERTVSLKKRKFSPEQKATIVRRYLRGKEPVSMLAEEFSIQPTQIHQWVALVLEKVEQVFEKSSKTGKPRQESTALLRMPALHCMGMRLNAHRFDQNRPRLQMGCIPVVDHATRFVTLLVHITRASDK